MALCLLTADKAQETEKTPAPKKSTAQYETKKEPAPKSPREKTEAGIIMLTVKIQNQIQIRLRYFPSTIVRSGTGSENKNLSVYCFFSSAQIFIVSIGTMTQNKKGIFKKKVRKSDKPALNQ